LWASRVLLWASRVLSYYMMVVHPLLFTSVLLFVTEFRMCIQKVVNIVGITYLHDHMQWCHTIETEEHSWSWMFMFDFDGYMTCRQHNTTQTRGYKRRRNARIHEHT